jgi:predicted lipoprotein with Yx(FWY)xxD motif
MKKSIGIATGTAMLLIAFCATQCSKKKDSTLAPSSKTVSLKSNATLGNYLADKNGRTLYFFSDDANGQNNCGGACATAWPAYSASNLTADQIDAGLNLADFNSITITGGTQLTYKGWPLYTYSPGGTPEAAGQITGDGVGGTWFVAKPDYCVMLANWQLVGGDGKNYKSDYTLGDGSTIFFTDALGRTLYAFKKDSANHNKFTKSDFSNDATWPSYDTATTLSVPSILNKSLFTSTNVFGKSQLTYNGWPLYRYGADSSIRTRTKGITVGGIGTIWPVMIKDIAPAPHP